MGGERLLKLLELLKKEYPEPKTALGFSNPLELLVATMLSAQMSALTSLPRSFSRSTALPSTTPRQPSKSLSRIYAAPVSTGTRPGTSRTAAK